MQQEDMETGITPLQALQQWHESNVQLIKDRMEKNGEIYNLIWALTEDRKIITISIPWEGYEERNQMIDIAMKLFTILKVAAYSHISEAWMAKYPIDDPEAEKIRPKDNPNRIEVVICNTTNISHALTYSGTIIRDDKGKYLRLDDEHTEMMERNDPQHKRVIEGSDMLNLMLPVDHPISLMMHFLSKEKRLALLDSLKPLKGRMIVLGEDGKELL